MGYTIWPDGDTGDVLREVFEERRRQEDLRRAGNFADTCASTRLSDVRKLAILAEEFGEAAKEVVDDGIASDKGSGSDWSVLHAAHRRNLREELIQIAAVAVAWVESIPKDKP